MKAASGAFLLTDLIYHAVLGMVRYFLGRPFPFVFALMSSHQPSLPGLSAQASSRLTLATAAGERATFQVLECITKTGPQLVFGGFALLAKSRLLKQ